MKKTSDLSILYIENDSKLQNEVSLHLKKIFSKVIPIHDASEGLLQYKKLKPDIVLTDLDFENISSFEMVVEMQDLNPDVSIIVLSKRNDDFDLLETLDLELVALLEKPLHFNSLNKALQKIIIQKPNKPKVQNTIPTKLEIPKRKEENKTQEKKEILRNAPEIQKEKPMEPVIVKTETKIQKSEIEEEKTQKKIEIPKIPEIDYTLCDEIFFTALNDKADVLCINSYKGLIISNNSKIIKFEHGLIMLQVTKTQLFSIIYERKVTLHINGKYISAKLFRINKEEGQIILKEPVLLNFKPRDKINKRLNVDKSFKVTMGFNNNHKELTATDVSINHLILESSTPLDIKSDTTVELTMAFEIDAPSSMIIDKNFTKVFAKGIIQRVDLLKNKQRIVIEHKIQTSGINVYKQYLQQREIGIITEFKSKMKNKL